MNSGSQFNKTISAILESSDLFTAAVERHTQVDEAKRTLGQKQSELDEAVSQINANLAGEVRRKAPRLDVWLTRHGQVAVKYGTRARQLCLQPDVINKTWSVDNTPFGRAFNKYYRDALKGSTEELAAAIAKFFSNNYKTLGGV